jgi:7,8-dihydropterin-6-yl-methyl-4-(beta-D-ribofuranosyl)aminobenzene 5'-phosphate synthase
MLRAADAMRQAALRPEELMNGSSSAVKVTIVVDNKAKPELITEHGFAAWIEVGDQHLLFDTGQGCALAVNADRLGIDLSRTDALVLSHGHFDHTGGVPVVIERAPGVQVYAHPAVTQPRYWVRDGAAHAIAAPETARAVLAGHDRVHWVTQWLEIADNVGVAGPIPRITEYEDTGGPFFTDSAGAFRDLIADEVALSIVTDRGLVVVTGCGHAGLINTLLFARQVSGEDRIDAVLGGFHLVEASDVRLGARSDSNPDRDGA